MKTLNETKKTPMPKKVIKERLNLFFNSTIHTHIKNTYDRFYNGYIIQILDKHIIFKDDVLGEIPMIIEEIEKIDYCMNIETKNLKQDFIDSMGQTNK